MMPNRRWPGTAHGSGPGCKATASSTAIDAYQAQVFESAAPTLNFTPNRLGFAKG